MAEAAVVFTDIEASTRLLQTHGSDVFADVVARHRSILRDVSDSFGGRIVGFEGDGGLLVFDNPVASLRACAEAQARFAAEAWAHGGRLRVRMGAHCGPVQWAGADIVGLTVHLAARVCGSAHGGQVVCTETAAIAAGLDLTLDARDLGLHRLKDIDEVQRLFQLGSAEQFPPLKTLSLRLNNLPAERTSFIGREETIRNGVALLRSGRLLTLTGPGGVGKTRTACEIAAALVPECAEGVWFARLETAREAHEVVGAALRAVGATEVGPDEGPAALSAHLRDWDTLLVLDNAEQVLEEVATLVELILSECPRVRVLVTSQEVLRVLGERVLRLTPLLQPDGSVSDAALRLFLDAALRADPTLPVGEPERAAAQRICRRLDGLPLALELAAAWVTGLGLLALADRIEQAPELPSVRGVAPRHRSLQAVLDWSHELLTPEQRTVFRRLAVFVREGDVGLAEAVCGDAAVPPSRVARVLAELVDKSLVIGLPGGRWRVLQLVADFAGEQLDAAGERVEIEARFDRAVTELCRRTDEVKLTPSRNEYVDRNVAQEANLVAALERARDRGGLTWEHREIVFCLFRVWTMRGGLRVADVLFPSLLSTPVGAAALAAQSMLHMWAGDTGCVKEASSAIRLARQLGDRRSESEAWRALAYVAMERDKVALADEAFRRSRALAVDTDMGVWLNGLAIQAQLYAQRGHRRCAQVLLAHVLELAEPTQNGQILGQVHTRLSRIERDLGELDSAADHARQAIAFQRLSGYGGTSIADSLLLAEVLVEQGRDLAAAEAIDAALSMVAAERERNDLPVGYRALLALLALLAGRADAPELARDTLRAVLTLTASARRDPAVERVVDHVAEELRLSVDELGAAPADLRVREVIADARAVCALLLADGAA